MNRQVDAPARERRDGMVMPLAVRHRLLNRRTTFAIDLLVMVAAFWLAYLLRFDSQVSAAHRQNAVYQLPLALAVQFAALYVSGAVAFVWKFVGMAEVPAFVRAGAASGAFLLCSPCTTSSATRFVVPRDLSLSKSLGMIKPLSS